MLEEIWEEAKDFFEDIFEHLFENDVSKRKSGTMLAERTKHAYHFTERVDSFMKIIFGGSIFISAVISSVWGFASVGDLVKEFVDSWPGRIVLIFIGTSYFINGIWRFFHRKS
jgi:hypothetical protein